MGRNTSKLCHSRLRGNDNFDCFYHEVRIREGVLHRVTENDCDLAIMGRPPEGLGTEKEAFVYHPPGIIAPESNREAAPSQRCPERAAGCGSRQGMKNTPITIYLGKFAVYFHDPASARILCKSV